MAGSIKIDSEMLNTAIDSLEALRKSTALDDAARALISSMPDKSAGASAACVEGYDEHLTSLNHALTTLFETTSTVLRNAEEYFTLTDEELAAYIAQNTESGT